MKRQVYILLVALLVFGCTPVKTSDSNPGAGVGAPPISATPTSAQGGTPGSLSAPASEAALPSPDSPEGCNDQALHLIRQGDLAGGIAAAQKALALNPKSAAGWFNLGRGYLGSGQAALAVQAFGKAHELSPAPNADVEYFVGQAETAAQRVIAARMTYERALQIWPADGPIAQALQALKDEHDTGMVTNGRIDVDGDGTVDMIAVAKGEVRVINSGTGEVLHVERSPFSDMKELSAVVEAYPLRGRTPLVRVSWNACPSGFNTFFWYDRRQHAFRQADGGGTCLGIAYQGDGRFEFIFPRGDKVLVTTRRWNTDHWVEEGSEERPRGK